MTSILSTQQLIDAFREKNIKERTRAFNSYLSALEENTKEDVQKLYAVIDGIIPQIFWETVLKVDIILHFKLFSHALDILKGGNKVLISKILKNAWFIEKLIVTYTPEEFVNDLFCFTSISARMKIINGLIKYNKDEEFGKELYKEYTEKYGLVAAKQLLPLCPVNVVEDVVINKEINLPIPTVRKVIGKDLKIAKHFFKNIAYRNKYELRYIARTNLPLLIEILRNCKMHKLFSFGSSTTHRLTRSYKDYILQSSSSLEFLNSLKVKRVYVDLKEEYEQLIYNLIVSKRYGTAFDTFKTVLSPLPKQKQREIYLKALKLATNRDWEDNPGFIDHFFFIQACDNVERDKYAEIMYNKTKQDDWIKYMSTEKSIPLYKKKLSTISRSICISFYIDMLIETCKINDDKIALLDVLKYAIKRLRNIKELECLIGYTLLHEFNLYELSEEHWKYINELEHLFKMNNIYFAKEADITHEQIIFCLKNDKSIAELLGKLHTKRISIEYNYRSDVGVEKEFILQSAVYWKDNIGDEDAKLNAYLHLLYAIQSYNSRHKDICINTKETLPIRWMVENLEGKNEQRFLYINSLFKYCLLEDVEFVERNKVIRIFFKRSEQDRDILLHLLKNKPKLLIENINNFLSSNAILQIIRSKKLLNYYRKFSYLDLNQTVVDYSIISLQNDKSEFETIKSLTVLSVCMDEQGYLNLIKQYYPDQNATVEKNSKLYKIRKAICKNMLNLNNPSLALNALLPFCVKDYLKFCLQSLYSLVFNIQENNLICFIKELRTKSEIIPKHATGLSLAALDRKHKLQFLRNIIENEKDRSVIALTIERVFKYFTKNLDKDFFELFKLLLKKIDKNDEKTFNVITDVRNLPQIFVAEYVKVVWNMLEEFNEQEFKYKDKQFFLLNFLNEKYYVLLEDELFDKILRKCMLSKYLIAVDPRTIVVYYLIYCNSIEVQNRRLQLFFDILRNFKESDEFDSDKMIQNISSIVTYFIDFVLTHKITKLDLIIEFKKHLNEFIDTVECYEEFLKLDLLEIHVQSLPQNYIISFSEKLALFLNNFAKQNGIDVLIYYKVNIRMYITLCLRTSEDVLNCVDDWYLFLHHLYTTSDSLAVAIMVLELMEPLRENVCSDTKQKYEDLIEKLKKRTELVIQQPLRLYIRQKHRRCMSSCC